MSSKREMSDLYVDFLAGATKEQMDAQIRKLLESDNPKFRLLEVQPLRYFSP